MAVEINLPDQSLQVVFKLRNVSRFEHVWGDAPGRVAPVPVWHQMIESYGEGVARFGTLYVERSGLRVSAPGYLLAVSVSACRIHGRGRNGVPVGDGQHGFVRTNRGVVVIGCELVMGHGDFLLSSRGAGHRWKESEPCRESLLRRTLELVPGKAVHEADLVRDFRRPLLASDIAFPIRGHIGTVRWQLYTVDFGVLRHHQ